MRKPHRGRFGDMPNSTGPRNDRTLIQVVMENDIPSPNPPDQRIPRATFASSVSLWAVEVNSDVVPIRDLKPERLMRVPSPPVVD